jgi:hypothetical protein
MGVKFIRTTEDFKCENCGNEVKGNGYTNHCPKCLWSKHVDIHPGDRASNCNGLMEPIRAELIRDGYDITYRCTKCKLISKNKSNKKDDFESILNIVKKHTDKIFK